MGIEPDCLIQMTVFSHFLIRNRGSYAVFALFPRDSFTSS
jgi:hypothetical protein